LLAFILIAAVALAVDQLLKLLVITFMQPGQSLAVVPHLIYLTYAQNPGGAFTILAHRTWLFIVLGIILVVALIVWRIVSPVDDWRITWSTGLLVGGVLGNLLDRLRTGYVTDYVDFQIWPVFNAADVFILTGVALLIWVLLTTQDNSRGG
jgi:signal peptidase II